MKPTDVIFVGVKNRVLAISKLDGVTLWSAELPSGLGQGFVTILSDGSHVFAHTHGQLHCLEWTSGRVLWTNELPGCGYGIASLCVAGAFAPDPAVVQQILAARQQAAASTTVVSAPAVP